MTPEDFTFVSTLLKDRTGLVLTRDKGYLVENRLMSVVRAHKMSGLMELIGTVRAGDPTTTAAFLDAMMSKETGFFRDWKPFKHLAKVVLANLRRVRIAKRNIRILVAGCSTGQEAYSIAMEVMEQAQQFSGWQIDIVGIDISPSAIAAAERGSYSQFDVQRGLPIRRLLRHFTKQDTGWKVNVGLQRMVSFQVWNLLDELYPLGRFDVILCRNVLISFDQQTKLAILQKLARLLVEDGVLYVGVTESVMGVSGQFRAVVANQGIYAAQRDGVPESRSLASA